MIQKNVPAFSGNKFWVRRLFNDVGPDSPIQDARLALARGFKKDFPITSDKQYKVQNQYVCLALECWSQVIMNGASPHKKLLPFSVATLLNLSFQVFNYWLFYHFPGPIIRKRLIFRISDSLNGKS